MLENSWMMKNASTYWKILKQLQTYFFSDVDVDVDEDNNWPLPLIQIREETGKLSLEKKIVGRRQEKEDQLFEIDETLDI